jgi:hypothetical protein
MAEVIIFAFIIVRNRLIKLYISDYSNEYGNVLSKFEKNYRNYGFECNQCCYYQRRLQDLAKISRFIYTS